jgi:hypothetical protein
MDRIKTQWGKLWQIISQPKTYTTYKEVGQVS